MGFQSKLMKCKSACRVLLPNCWISKSPVTLQKRSWWPRFLNLLKVWVVLNPRTKSKSKICGQDKNHEVITSESIKKQETSSLEWTFYPQRRSKIILSAKTSHSRTFLDRCITLMIRSQIWSHCFNWKSLTVFSCFPVYQKSVLSHQQGFCFNSLDESSRNQPHMQGWSYIFIF